MGDGDFCDAAIDRTANRLAHASKFKVGSGGVAPRVAAGLSVLLDRQVTVQVNPFVLSTGTYEKFQLSEARQVGVGACEGTFHWTPLATVSKDLHPNGRTSTQMDVSTMITLESASQLAQRLVVEIGHEVDFAG